MSDTQLLEITQPWEAPPLHQSTEVLTACESFYVEAIIRRKKQPGGMESARGIQVHRAGALYAAWCAHKGVDMDLEAFDRFSEGAGPAAAKILIGMRESYRIDWQHLFATEVSMSLDAYFDPTDVIEPLQGICEDSGLPPHYSGIMDVLNVYQAEGKILIPDLKTHPRPYDPSEPDKSLQGKMYALFAFKHFPWAEEVTFQLIFVRYKGCTREVTYTRADVPKLIESVKFARARQLSIHRQYNEGKTIEATAGSHCLYCPLLSNRKCSIAEFNPNMQLTPEQRLNFHIWYAAFSKVNNKALKDRVDGTGRAVIHRDNNGKVYVYGYEDKERTVYPLFHGTEKGIAYRCHRCGAVSDRALDNNQCPGCKNLMVPIMPIVSLLNDYAGSTPSDTKWMSQLSISSTKMNSFLGAKSRAFLDQSVQDTADKVSKPKLKLSKPLDSVPDEEPEEEGLWDEDEDEF